MSDNQAVEAKFKKAAGIIGSAGMIPFAVTETLLEIIKFYLDEDDADHERSDQQRIFNDDCRIQQHANRDRCG